MRKVLLATTMCVGLVTVAHATQVTSFGQSSGSNTVTATVNGAATQTTLSITDASVLIDQLLDTITPPALSAFLTLNAMSIDAAVPIGPAILQHYTGSFCISFAIGCSGAVDLQGVFTDAAFGLGGGDQLSVNVSNPPDTLTLTSSVIPASQLLAPSSFTLSMSNISNLAIDNTTIAPFTASFSGVADASSVPEPMPLAVLGFGLAGLCAVRWRRT